MHKFTTAEKNTLARAARILEKSAKYEAQTFTNPQAAKELLSYKLADKDHEVFSALFLNTQNQLIEYREMFTGTIDRSAVYPREVAKKALQLNASAVIIAHNHPSGSPEPSNSDINITGRLSNALSLLDIRLLDHIIVGHGKTVSLADRGQV